MNTARFDDSIYQSDPRPIGVFDSGIGGLTVLREIWNALPNENTIYFGDNGRTPYGTKSHDTIVKYSLQNMRFLLSQDVKMIVIACNSASAHAYHAVWARANVPVVEVITPGAEQALITTQTGRIGIIATRATVNSGIYKAAVEEEAGRMLQSGQNTAALSQLYIEQVACPLFVSLAEEGWWDSPITHMAAEEYLKDLRKSSIDTLILGCTHYPLLIRAIADVMGEQTALIHAGASVAQRVSQSIDENELRNNSGKEPYRRFYTSDDPLMFENLAAPFLGGGRPSGTERVMTEEYFEEEPHT
jgi:glutamate racemase